MTPTHQPVLAFLERLVDPFPGAAPEALPNRLLPFLWRSTKGARRYIAAMTAFTAAIGAFEAWLFAAMSRILDWLAQVPAAELWARERGNLLLLAAVLASSIALATLQSTIKHQVVNGNLAMRLRWNFHRLMLAQSMEYWWTFIMASMSGTGPQAYPMRNPVMA